jgi:membrane protease YdiL (CAAX protease family)
MKIDALIVADRAPVWQRAAVLVLCVAVYLGGRELTKLLRPFIDPLVNTIPDGPRTVAQHWLVYSLVTAIVCAIAWVALAKANRLRMPRFAFNRSSFLWGIGVGLGVSAVTALVWAFVGPGFQVKVGGWKMLGDLLSNLYEEVAYRGLVFGGALYAVRQPVVAALLAGAVFGWSHNQFPVVFQIFTALVGAAFALGYLRTGTIVTAWSAHQVSDMVLDTFLKT